MRRWVPITIRSAPSRDARATIVSTGSPPDDLYPAARSRDAGLRQQIAQFRSQLADVEVDEGPRLAQRRGGGLVTVHVQRDQLAPDACGQFCRDAQERPGLL